MKTANPLFIMLAACCSLICFSNMNTFAQATDNATLSVNLSDVRSIKVNPAQTNVQLNFATSDDYQNGVSSAQVAHLTVVSTGAYQIKVKASGADLLNGANTIPVNTITLTPTLNSGYSDPTATFTPVNLTATDQPLIINTAGSPEVKFDVDYRAAGGAPYINKTAGTYVTTITFSIEPS